MLLQQVPFFQIVIDDFKSHDEEMPPTNRFPDRTPAPVPFGGLHHAAVYRAVAVGVLSGMRPCLNEIGAAKSA